jgi:hypothetical protein
MAEMVEGGYRFVDVEGDTSKVLVVVGADVWEVVGMVGIDGMERSVVDGSLVDVQSAELGLYTAYNQWVSVVSVVHG